MKKGKSKTHTLEPPESIPEPEPLPLDVLTVKIKSLRLPEDTPTLFTVNVTFYDQVVLTGVIESTPARATVKEKTVLMGSISYDPSDYDKMSIISGNPLCVQVHPLDTPSSSNSTPNSNPSKGSKGSQNSKGSKSKPSPPSLSETYLQSISCCNIDILPLFIDKDKIHVKKRLQPRLKPSSILNYKSWDNLPLLNIKIQMTRNPLNERHHKVLKDANWIQLTMIGAYNMLIPYSNEYVYSASSRMPLHNLAEFGLVTFYHGYSPKRFCSLNFNPKWENLRVGDRNFTQGETKFESSIEEIQNDDNIPIGQYLDKANSTTIWGSFHRALLLNADTLLWRHIRQFHWPLEVHIYGETRGFSFMAFLNLFKLLYPGEDTVRIAAPLQWINAEAMQRTCGCDLLQTPHDKASSTYTTKTARTERASSLDTSSYIWTTGANDDNAFVLVEVKLARPLRKVVVPRQIPSSDLNEMLKEAEQAGPLKRECTGRGQQDRDWRTTVRNAATALRKVPYYGTTELCQFNRQLSETRTRVELTTSCWQDAAIYINNNFVVQDCLESDESFEEMVMVAHACLIKAACVTLVGKDNKPDVDPTLRAARHARQMQDIPHATELYLQAASQKPRDANCWRELSTCLKDSDRDWANVCINKSVVMDPRQPLSLFSKGCMLFEENPALAEPFFVALLAMFPLWSVGCIIANAYYIQMEMYHMAETILEHNARTLPSFLISTTYATPPRTWESELGDWWDTAPILSGMSQYYNAADLLLRLRCIRLAEVCISLALCEGGETAVYYHLVALCCRLQGNTQDALCHVQAGIGKYGEISYLRSLEAECLYKLGDIAASTASFEKAGNCTGSYCIQLSTVCRERQRVRTTLVDLSRRQPSAYVWMALADDWMTRAGEGEADTSGQTAPAAAKTCAAMCAVQALKWDRRAGRAWALLANLVKPSARRLHCMQMAYECGYTTSKGKMETAAESKQSLCHRLGRPLKECRCCFCKDGKT